MKKHKLIGAGITIAGVVAYVADQYWGAGLALVGIIWFIVGRSFD